MTDEQREERKKKQREYKRRYAAKPEAKAKHKIVFRRWQLAHPERVNQLHREWYAKNAEKQRAEYAANREERCRKMRERLQGLKRQVFAHYGNRCACCWESNPVLLTLDHINNDGAQQRTRRGTTGQSRGSTDWRGIIRSGFPTDLQILCWNCNCAKQYHGEGACHPPDLALAGNY